MLKLFKADLTKPLTITTAQTHFLVNGRVYDQIDCIARDSPSAPILADRFLGHYEQLWLNEYKGPSVDFYRRYLDDNFYLFNIEHEAFFFLDISIHSITTLGSLWKSKLAILLPFLASSLIIKILFIL